MGAVPEKGPGTVSALIDRAATRSRPRVVDAQREATTDDQIQSVTSPEPCGRVCHRSGLGSLVGRLRDAGRAVALVECSMMVPPLPPGDEARASVDGGLRRRSASL